MVTSREDKALSQSSDLEPEVSVRGSKPLTVADGPSFAGTSFDEPTLSPGKFDLVLSRSSLELFLSGFFLSLLRAGFVDLGVNDGVEGGWDSCANSRPKGLLEHDQSNLAVIPTKVVDDVPGESVLVVEDLNNSDMGFGGEDSLSIPLMSITPFGLPLSAVMNCGNEALECVDSLDISSWVKNRLPGFSKLVELPLSRHEKLCIALLQKIEKEAEDAKVLNRKVTVPRKAVINKDRGKRELRNLQSSVNYDGR